MSGNSDLASLDLQESSEEVNRSAESNSLVDQNAFKDLIHPIEKFQLPPNVLQVVDTLERREQCQCLLIPDGGQMSNQGNQPVLAVKGINGEARYIIGFKNRMLFFDSDGNIYYGKQGRHYSGKFNPAEPIDTEAPIISIGELIDYVRGVGKFA